MLEGRMIISEEIKVTPFQREVWEDNYRAPGEKDIIALWRRLAKAAASVEDTEEKKKAVEDIFLMVMYDWKFVAAGRTTANIGVEGRESTTLSSCFTTSPIGSERKDPDSIEGIYALLGDQAKVLKSEGGYGMSFDWMRPAGMYVAGIGGRTPGVLKFMELWDKSSEIITSGSEQVIGPRMPNEKKKSRKGAQMGVLSCWHPEIEAFIDAKSVPHRLTKFNLSVGIVEGFMQAVIDDADWDLIFPDTTVPEYKEVWDGSITAWKAADLPIIVYKTIKARELWEKIMLAAYNRNEPGVLFLDKINELNPLFGKEEIVATNPCSEAIPGNNGACNLASMGLVKYIDFDTKGAFFDMESFLADIPPAVRFLDNVVDVTRAPLEIIDKSMKATRRIGLGVLGLGSLHYMLGIRYGSPDSVKFVVELFKAKCQAEITASAVFGTEKGSFPDFDAEHYFNTPWWNNLPLDKEFKDAIKARGAMRNALHSANAPTGNLGIFAGVMSGGIEPVFSKEYTRWSIVNTAERTALRANGIEWPEVMEGEWFETKDFKFVQRGDEGVLSGKVDEVRYEIDKSRGLTKATLIEDYGWTWVKEHYSEEAIFKMDEAGIFASADELTAEEHLNVLKAIVPFVNMSTSKTVNVANNFPFEDFKGMWMDAWESGIKGLTTYRAGTMTAVLEKGEAIERQQNVLAQMFDRAGEDVLVENVKLPIEYFSKGFVRKDKNKKKWYFNLAFTDKKLARPFALFITTNNRESSDVAIAVSEGLGVLITNAGVDSTLISKLKDKMKGQSNVQKIARAISMALRHNISMTKIVDVLNGFDDEFSSLLFHIKKVLSTYIPNGEVIKDKICPICGKEMVYQEGCSVCIHCGHSAC